MIRIIEAMDGERIDPVTRLRWSIDLLRDIRTILVRRRDAAAYEVLLRYSSRHAEDLVHVERHLIAMWVTRHCERTGAARPRRRAKRDLSNAIDLSDAGRFPTSRHR